MPNAISLTNAKTKKPVDWNNIKVVRIPYDGAPNRQNPYDRLTLEEREKKIIAICRKIWLRRIEEGKTKQEKP